MQHVHHHHSEEFNLPKHAPPRRSKVDGRPGRWTQIRREVGRGKRRQPRQAYGKLHGMNLPDPPVLALNCGAVPHSAHPFLSLGSPIVFSFSCHLSVVRCSAVMRKSLSSGSRTFVICAPTRLRKSLKRWLRRLRSCSSHELRSGMFSGPRYD